MFRASRYDKGGDDAYVNCPFDEAQYDAFVAAVRGAEKVAARAFEELRYFEGCLPVEVMAERGERTLAFGPMKPVGLDRSAHGAAAVRGGAAARRRTATATAYNMVGFQTRMTQPEQRRVFALIPGLEKARVRALRQRAPQHVRQRAGRARRHARAARAAGRVPGGADHRRRGLRRERGVRAVRRHHRSRSGCTAAPARRRPRRRRSARCSATCAGRAPTSSRRTWCGACSRRSADARRQGRKERREALAARALEDLEHWKARDAAAGERRRRRSRCAAGGVSAMAHDGTRQRPTQRAGGRAAAAALADLADVAGHARPAIHLRLHRVERGAPRSSALSVPRARAQIARARRRRDRRGAQLRRQRRGASLSAAARRAARLLGERRFDRSAVRRRPLRLEGRRSARRARSTSRCTTPATRTCCSAKALPPSTKKTPRARRALNGCGPARPKLEPSAGLGAPWPHVRTAAARDLLAQQIERFLERLRAERRAAPRTAETYGRDLRALHAFAASRLSARRAARSTCSRCAGSWRPSSARTARRRSRARSRRCARSTATWCSAARCARTRPRACACRR